MKAEIFDSVSASDNNDFQSGNVIGYDGANNCGQSRKAIRLRILTEHCNTLPVFSQHKDAPYDVVTPLVAHYRVLNELGRGSMGVVYHAHDQRSERDVALKVMDTRVVTDGFQAMRFDGEAGMVSAISHPHVIKIHGHGFVDDYAYLCLELLSGENLKQRIRCGLDLDQVLHYMMQLSSALSAVHAQGVIHHDVKSSNILFRHNTKLVLSDFGISSKRGAPRHRHRACLPIGTPAYMSPEQFIGEPTDERSDLYSMGIVLYEMLTGHLPYQGFTTQQLFEQHKSGNLPAIPNVPADIEKLLHGLLAKNPEQRITSSGEVGKRLSMINGV
jgi:serine/threonine protein kinase